MVKKERFNKKLLVEGNNDLHVVCALCYQHQIPETFDVIKSQSPYPYLVGLAGKSGYTHGAEYHKKVSVNRSGNMFQFYSVVNRFVYE